MDITGLSLCMAWAKPGMALAKPGVVYMHTPGWRVMRPQASAMWTAACSWRVSMKRKSRSLITSSTGRMWSPARVKMLFTPSSLRA